MHVWDHRSILLAGAFWEVAIRGGGGQFAVLQAISHVDHNADGSPDGESNPRHPWEKAHEAEASQHAQDGDDRHERKPEWAWLVGFRVS